VNLCRLLGAFGVHHGIVGFVRSMTRSGFDLAFRFSLPVSSAELSGGVAALAMSQCADSGMWGMNRGTDEFSIP